uniref:Gfo/Idh/MocA family oxidoreductase n=1 Tax=candidate division WOR-3 bacterium TaxID=2052148 RepID=A0A7C4U7F2_UNCW3
MKIGVIGLGYWGPNLLRNLFHFPDVQPVGCDSDIKRIDVMKKVFPNAEYNDDYKILLKDDNLKAVVIATPVSTHFEIAKEFLLSGKDVFVEKPLTKSSKEAEELIEIAEKEKRVLMVGHTFMFNPAVLKIKEFIKNGDIGELYYITSTRVNLGIHRKDASVIWDLAPHDLSMIFTWMDADPVHINGVGKESIIKGLPDVAFLQIIFDNGVIADIQVGWLSPSKIRKTIIVGSKKMIEYDDTDPQEKVKVFDSGVDVQETYDYGEYLLQYRTGDIYSPKIPGSEPLKLEMEHFINCIKKREKPISDGKIGLKIVKILEQAESSIKKANGSLI